MSECECPDCLIQRTGAVNQVHVLRGEYDRLRERIEALVKEWDRVRDDHLDDEEKYRAMGYAYGAAGDCLRALLAEPKGDRTSEEKAGP